MLSLVGCVIAGLVGGWLAHGLQRRSDFRTAERRWQGEIEALEARIALERLQTDYHLRQQQQQEGAPEAPKLELLPEPKHARPRRRTPDPSAARA